MIDPDDRNLSQRGLRLLQTLDRYRRRDLGRSREPARSCRSVGVPRRCLVAVRRRPRCCDRCRRKMAGTSAFDAQSMRRLRYRAPAPIASAWRGLRRWRSTASTFVRCGGLIAKLLDGTVEAGEGLDLSLIAQLLGDKPAGLAIQHEILTSHRLFRSPCASNNPRLRVLALAAPTDMGSNTPIEFLLEESAIELMMLYVIPDVELPVPLPDHDVAIVIASDSEDCRDALRKIDAAAPRWPRPLLNPPQLVGNLDRDKLHRAARRHRRLEIPATIGGHARAIVATCRARPICSPTSPPILLFPSSSVRADRMPATVLRRSTTAPRWRAISTARQELEFFISRFVDYASDDGLFRKYRLVFVDGRPYACHMAIADRWDIWYLNAGMSAECSQASRRRDVHAHLRHRLRAAASDGARPRWPTRIGLDYFTVDCAETKDGSLLMFEADNTAVVHNMDPPDCFPTSRRRCARCSTPSPRCSSGMRERLAGARGVTMMPREQHAAVGIQRDARSAGLDELRAHGHRMLDDMIDYVANIRERPVWQPIPDEVRAQFRDELPRAPMRSRRRLSRVHRFHRALCDRQRSSGLHGLGAWRRHRGRHAGGDACGRAQRQSRRPRSHADRGRAPDRRMGAPDVRLSERSERHFRHRHVDGQFDGGAGGAHGALGQSVAAARHRRGRRAADGLYFEGGAWLHHQGHGHCGFRQRRVALDRGRSIASHRCRRAARADRARSRRRAEAVSGGRLRRHRRHRRDRRSRRRCALCREERLWFHVDGAFGALGILSPELAPRLAGIENADSIALDFHKWGQVPYDAGFLLVRDGERHRDDVRRAGGLSAPRDARACRRLAAGPAISVPICRAASAR